MNGDAKDFSRAPSMRVVLQSYEQQLLAARRLARFRSRARTREGLDARDPDPAENRERSVRAVASELMNLLVFTGLSPELLEEMRLELNAALKKDFEFVFPPDSNLRVYIRENGERRPLSEAEQRQVTVYLQHIARVKVDKTMISPARRDGLYC